MNQALLIKAGIKIIGTENIKNGIYQFASIALDFKEKYVLQPSEIDLIGVVVERGGKLYFMTATIDDNNNLVRIENQYLLDDLIVKLLKQI